MDYTVEIRELTMQSVHQIYMMLDSYPSVDRYSKRTQKSLMMKLNKVLANGNSSDIKESKSQENRLTGLNNLWVTFSSRPLFHMRPEIFRNKSELSLSLNEVLNN